MAKQRIRLTEGQLHNIIRKCVNEAVNEMATSSDKAIEGFRQLVDRLNGIVESQKSQYGDAWLIEKDGSHYQLTQPVRLMNNGVLVVSTQYSFGSGPEVEKIRVFTKRGGKVVLYKDDRGIGYCNDARYAKKLLTKMIADAERSGKHLEGYDPNWDDEGKAGEKKIRGFERSIGIRR